MYEAIDNSEKNKVIFCDIQVHKSGCHIDTMLINTHETPLGLCQDHDQPARTDSLRGRPFVATYIIFRAPLEHQFTVSSVSYTETLGFPCTSLNELALVLKVYIAFVFLRATYIMYKIRMELN